MSNSNRNSKIRQKLQKNTNHSDDLPQKRARTKNTLFKAKKTKNRHPERSRDMKSHAPAVSLRSNRSSIKRTGEQIPWIWGLHAAKAAIENPKRTVHEINLTPGLAERPDFLPNIMKKGDLRINIVSPSELDTLLPPAALHQGIAVYCTPLPTTSLDMLVEPASGLIVVLDRITDPHNVGAIFRLAAAFGAKAVIMQDRYAPPLSGAVAKVAVGTIETVPHILVTNIANTLLSLRDAVWRVTGLAGEADITLAEAVCDPDAEVVVMGAEGSGLRQRVRDCCDQLAKIPMPGSAESLNVSTAAAIALYEAMRGQKND